MRHIYYAENYERPCFLKCDVPEVIFVLYLYTIFCIILLNYIALTFLWSAITKMCRDVVFQSGRTFSTSMLTTWWTTALLLQTIVWKMHWIHRCTLWIRKNTKFYNCRINFTLYVENNWWHSVLQEIWRREMQF
jgi:hypothetical protein